MAQEVDFSDKNLFYECESHWHDFLCKNINEKMRRWLIFSSCISNILTVPFNPSLTVAFWIWIALKFYTLINFVFATLKKKYLGIFGYISCFTLK